MTVNSQTESVVGYPLLIDLSTLPSNFWENVYYDAGYDLRVKTASGTDLPFDLASFNMVSRKGTLFVKMDLGTEAKEIYLHYGHSSQTLVEPTSPIGRNTVWSGFECVYTLGGSVTDRTGKRPDLELDGYHSALNHYESINIPKTDWPDTNMCRLYHYPSNGIVRIMKQSILRYEITANAVIVTNNSPLAGVGSSNDFSLDGGVLINNRLFVMALHKTVFANSKILVFRISDLAKVDEYPISFASGVIGPGGVVTGVGLTYSPLDKTIYMLLGGSSTNSRNNIWKYSLVDEKFTGTILLSKQILADNRAIAYWNENFVIGTDQGSLELFTKNGVAKGTIYGVGSSSYLPYYIQVERNELVYDHAVLLKRLRSSDVTDTSVLGSFYNDRLNYAGASVPKLTSWTIGISTNRKVNVSVTQGIASYTTRGLTSSNNTVRECIAIRDTNVWGLWNITNSWIFDSQVPDVNKAYRLHATHDGVVSRKIYVNGVLGQSQNNPSLRPGNDVVDPMIYLGIGEGADTSQYFRGAFGFFYLFNGIRSQKLLEIESTNINSPLSLYSVGPIESLPF